MDERVELRNEDYGKNGFGENEKLNYQDGNKGDGINEWKPEDYYRYSLNRENDKANFIRKVYLLLSFQFFVTFLFVLISVFSDGFRDFVYENWWVMIISSVLAIIVIVVLFYSKKARRNFPLNYILMFTFTLLMSFTLACICAFYYPEVILMAFGITLCITIALTIYSFFIDENIVILIGISIVLPFGMIMFLLTIILIGSDDIYRLVFCPLAVILYGIYLVLDTYYMVADDRYGANYDDYIIGVVSLYIDIIGMFTYILAIFSKR
jgi:FtsH-binding integral membrane protein